MAFKLLICDPITKKSIEYLKNQGFEYTEFTGKTEEEIVKVIPEYDGVIVRSATKITEKILKAGIPKLKVAGRAGVGYDNINIAAASECGVVVMNSPFGNSISACEHAIGLLMSVARKINLADAKMKNKVWDKKSFVGVELNGKTVGIVGYGRIGSEVARRLQAFNMKVLCYDPYVNEEAKKKSGFTFVDFDKIIAESNILTLHLPLTDQTKNMINKETMGRMKNNMIIVNCARGGLINEADLLEVLKSDPSKFWGVGLDVFEDEPTKNFELCAHEKVCATPHLGASTKEAQELVSIQICEQIVAALTNKVYTNAINLDKIKKNQ